MTFPAIRLPYANLIRFVPAAHQTPQTEARPEDKSDLRRVYIERLMTADACIGEFGVQALMGLYPKDF